MSEKSEAKAARLAQLRANVSRRRVAYVLFILLAIGVFALSIVDIVYLDSKLEFILVFPLYVLLFVLAIILLFSRRRQQEDIAEIRDLERALLQCPDCKNVFQYGAINFHDANKTAFSCPVCGVFSALPDPDQEPVKVLRPEGDFREIQYHCNNCTEDLAVGTFGETPLHLVRFRACPHCSEKGHIVRIATPAPENFQGDGGFTPA